ncbi:MAG: Rieske (2Fe-2S) protein [Salinirussus sp.]
MSERHKVANEADLEEGSRAFVEVGGVEIAVFNVEGEYYAVANYCVHQGGPLCEGELTGRYGMAEDGWSWTYDPTEKNVVCPWHGWKFDVTTGRSPDDDRYVAPTYDVEVEDGEIYVVR